MITQADRTRLLLDILTSQLRIEKAVLKYQRSYVTTSEYLNITIPTEVKIKEIKRQIEKLKKSGLIRAHKDEDIV